MVHSVTVPESLVEAGEEVGPAQSTPWEQCAQESAVGLSQCRLGGSSLSLAEQAALGAGRWEGKRERGGKRNWSRQHCPTVLSETDVMPRGAA